MSLMHGSGSRLRRIATLATDYDQVPNQVQVGLELVRTCDRDLHDLIQLRIEQAAALEQDYITASRVDSIINEARKGLDRVYKLVENCRPEAHEGKTPFKNKIRWMLVDSLDFEGHKPVIRQHHGYVLEELNRLRQMARVASSKQQQIEETREEKTPKVEVKAPQVFENLDLLGDIFEDPSMPSGNPPTSTPAGTQAKIPVINMTYTQVNMHPRPLSCPPKEWLQSPEPEVFELDSTPHTTTPALHNGVYCDEKQVVAEGSQQILAASKRIVLGSVDMSGLSLLFPKQSASTHATTSEHSRSLASSSHPSLASSRQSPFLPLTLGDSSNELIGELDGSQVSTIADASSTSSSKSQQHRMSLPLSPVVIDGEDALIYQAFQRKCMSSHRKRKSVRTTLHKTETQEEEDTDWSAGHETPGKPSIETARVEKLSPVPAEVVYIHKKSSSWGSTRYSPSK